MFFMIPYSDRKPKGKARCFHTGLWLCHERLSGADSDLDAGQGDVLLHSLDVLVQLVVMGNQLLDGDTHFLGLGQEAQSVDVFLSAVNPGANQGDFLVAQVEVGVHGALASVDEEAHLAVAAATTDILVSISSSLGNTSALEDEVSTEALGQSLDLSDALFDGLQFAEVDDVGSAHFLSQVQTGLDTVNSDDVDNAGSLQNGDLHQTDGATALNQNGGGEVDDVGGLSAVPGVDTDASGLDQHTLVQSLVVDDEDGGVLTDQDVLSKPAVVVMLCIVLDQAVNTQTGAQVGQFGIALAVIALAAQQDGGNDLVADLDGIALGVNGHAFADSDDFTGAFMAQNDFLVTKGIVTILMDVGAADAAAFNLNQDFTGTGGGDFNVSQFDDCFAFDTVNDLGFNEISYLRSCHI